MSFQDLGWQVSALDSKGDEALSRQPLLILEAAAILRDLELEG